MNSSWPQLETIHTIVFDFDGVFTDNTVYVDENGCESVKCHRGDGLAIDFLRAYQTQRQQRINLFILSKEKNKVVAARAKKLGIVCHYGVDNKLGYLRRFFQEKFPSIKNPMSGVIYLGNDLNDLAVMRSAGFSVAPNDAHDRIKAISSAVLPVPGGQAFVRAFVEKLLNMEVLSTGELDELISYC